ARAGSSTGTAAVTVDVVVPVHCGLEEAAQCIESILSSPQEIAFELIVVNDAAPDPELHRWLRGQRDRQRIALLEQSTRQGFAAAVNRALALHPDRDTVVVHSDAQVADDWLDRLAGHAA